MTSLAKRNLQVPEYAPAARELGELILAALGRNPTFVSAALPLKPFWVERGEPLDYFKAEKLPAAGEYFSFIEGVEVDFSYR